MGLLDQIKQEARGNRTTIQTSDAAELARIFNTMFFMPKDPDEEVAFVRHVMTRGLETQERVGLHASALIKGEKDYCVREQVLSLIYRQAQGENVSVGLKRIFAEGDSIHEKWQRLFIRAGFSKAKHLDASKYNEEYMISYTPDIACKIPEFYDGVMLGEIKSVNTFQYQKMAKHPSASRQLQWYMHLTGIHKGFVINEDKNTQDFKLEVYDYDPAMVATPVDRAEQIMYYYNRVVNEGKMVGRPKDAKGPSCKRCTKCNMQDACWNIGKGRIRIA